MQMNTATFFKRTVLFVAVATAPVLIWYLFDVILITIGAIVLATAEFPHTPIELKVSARQHGSNRKLSNLATSVEMARHDILATVALRRDTLRRIGGFRAFADCLADDYAIGKAVREAGYAVAVAPFAVGHVCVVRDRRAFLAHELRVARTIKSIDPLGHAGAVLTHPFPLALVAAVFGGPWALAAAALFARLVLCGAVARAFSLPRQPYWLVPFQDLLSFAVFVASFFGSRVSWSGVAYRVSAAGTLAVERSRLRP